MCNVYHAFLHTKLIRAALEMKVKMTINKYLVIKVIHMATMCQYVFKCSKDGIVEYHYLHCADLHEAVQKHEMIYGWDYKVLRVDINETSTPDVVQSKIGDYITL